jgi:transposase
MGKAKQLSQQQRCQIIALSRHTSKTHREIAIDLNVSQSSVTKIINLHKSTGGTTVRERSGRPRITSETTDRMMRREVVKDPFITPKQIQQNLASHLEKVSLRTIRRRLQAKYGMTARKPLKKPLLTINITKNDSCSANVTKSGLWKCGRKSCSQTKAPFSNIPACPPSSAVFLAPQLCIPGIHSRRLNTHLELWYGVVSHFVGQERSHSSTKVRV